MHEDLDRFCVQGESTIRDAIACMDRRALGIVLILSADGKLEGTITDGDVRRIMLAGIDLDQSVRTALERKKGTRYERPITSLEDRDQSEWFNLLQEHRILHLPIIGNNGQVVGLVTLDEFVRDERLPVQAVVMAGGAGKRLHPLTENTPKPMLRIGDKPLLQIIIEQLRDAGVNRVHVATHHQSEKIKEHFGDGSQFGVEVAYVAEDQPLGTAGALGLMERAEETMLVINGDILTDVNFRAILSFHREHAADLTMAVREYDIQLPYGVVEVNGAQVHGLREKPVEKYFVNAGIYLLEPVVRNYLPKREKFDMTDVVQAMIDADRSVVSFPIREYWLDIGQHEDYESVRNLRRDSDETER